MPGGLRGSAMESLVRSTVFRAGGGGSRTNCPAHGRCKRKNRRRGRLRFGARCLRSQGCRGHAKRRGAGVLEQGSAIQSISQTGVPIAAQSKGGAQLPLMSLRYDFRLVWSWPTNPLREDKYIRSECQSRIARSWTRVETICATDENKPGSRSP